MGKVALKAESHTYWESVTLTGTFLSELTNTSVGAMRLFIGTGGSANESATKTEDALAESRNARIAAKSLSLCDPEVLAAC